MAAGEKRCAVCGAPFVPYRKTQRYCCNACYRANQGAIRKVGRRRRREREREKDETIARLERMVELLAADRDGYRCAALELARRQGLVDGSGRLVKRG